MQPEINPDFTEDKTDLLYDSSSMSVMETLAILFNWFGSYPGISKEAFSRLLFILHAFVLPTGNILPASYSKAYSIISNKLVPVQTYHCCVNDCIVYRNSSEGDFEKLQVCPVCGQQRYEPESKIPRKVFKYVPLEPRLRRMFRDKSMSAAIQQHQCFVHSPDVHDIQQSAKWNELYSCGPFCGDPRSVSLALCLDGMNPFSKDKVQYSMTPITLTMLNLPRHIRNTAGSMFLAGIIPGRSEPHTYVNILVDEVIEMNGINMYDGYREEFFKLKVAILLHVVDYPGQNKLFHCQGTYLHNVV